MLIDCPPSLGLLTVNALTAADGVLIPIQTEYYALEGLSQLVNTIRRVREGLNPRLEIEGVVLTMYDARTNLSAQVASEVRRHMNGTVYETVVPRSVRLSEAPSHGLPIALYDPASRGAARLLGARRRGHRPWLARPRAARARSAWDAAWTRSSPAGEERGVLEIPLDRVEPNPDQPRADLRRRRSWASWPPRSRCTACCSRSSFATLADGSYQLIAGERRAACRTAGRPRDRSRRSSATPTTARTRSSWH